MMVAKNNSVGLDLDQLTKRAVRAFWLDGLWEIACAGAFLIIGLWGVIYFRFLAFPSWTWYFQQGLGKNIVWIGLVVLVIVQAAYLSVSWLLVKALKRRMVSPYIGHVEHSFFLTTDPKVFAWYFGIYLVGLVILYSVFYWVKGGAYITSVPLIISPAAILWGIGKVYKIPRYKWISITGFMISFLLEIILTSRADYYVGPQNFLQVLPEWGNPILACLVWSVLFIVSGLIGLISIQREQ